jgi:hypothetical protein
VVDRRELTETLGSLLSVLMARRIAKGAEQPTLPLREPEPKRTPARPKARAAE